MNMKVTLSLLAVICLTLAAPAARAQTCTVTLSEINYDCALAAGQNGDTCEFVELLFQGFSAGDTVDSCGVTDLEFMVGTCRCQNCCEVYTSVALPGDDIPTDGLYVVGKDTVANVDLTPADWADNALNNGGRRNEPAPAYVRFVAGNGVDHAWFGYEFDAGDLDCAVEVDGASATFIHIGADVDPNQDDGVYPPEREESVALCGTSYLGEEDGVWTGPAESPGVADLCERLPWVQEDGGVSEDAAVGSDATASSDAATGADAGTSEDAAIGSDAATGADAGTSEDATAGTDAATGIDVATEVDGAVVATDAATGTDSAVVATDAATGSDAGTAGDATVIGGDAAAGIDAAGSSTTAPVVEESGCACGAASGAPLLALASLGLLGLRRRRRGR